MTIINTPTDVEMAKFLEAKYGGENTMGWAPRQRKAFGYVKPGDYYEFLVQTLINSETRWVDVGGGSAIFPNNHKLSVRLSSLCQILVAVDPSENVSENPYCHEFSVCMMEDYDSGQTNFDVATLRMVAEHVTNTDALTKKFSELMDLNGIIVIYTIFKYSPIPLVTRITPFGLHHPIKRFLWKTQEKDTFPVAYKLNTRKEISASMNQAGFDEISFRYLDDLSVFSRFRWASFMELVVWKLITSIGLPYPERNILAVYKKR